MRVRWIHTADVHLGNQQYGLAQRSKDFARAFKYVCDHAIQSHVDFMLVAGDLFHKRNVDPLTISQAYDLLTRLKEAGIPVYCVEGNHERAYYSTGLTWLDFLSNAGLLYLLSPSHSEGVTRLEPWDDAARAGGYVDHGPVRICGIKYYGAAAGRVLEHISAQLAGWTERPFNIVMLHEGMEGQIPRAIGGLSSTQLELLRPHCEYLALGHIHKQYEFGEWAFNPGSLETVSAEEVDWPRGYYDVAADTDSRALVEVKRLTVPIRPFLRYSIPVETCDSPAAVERLVLSQTEQRFRRANGERPVVNISLRGTLQFSEDALDIPGLERAVTERFDVLIVRIKNNTAPVGYNSRAVLDEDGQIDRRALELQVLAEKIGLDARYATNAEELAKNFQQIKNLALEDTPPSEMIEELERALAVARAPKPAGVGVGQ